MMPHKKRVVWTLWACDDEHPNDDFIGCFGTVKAAKSYIAEVLLNPLAAKSKPKWVECRRAWVLLFRREPGYRWYDIRETEVRK